MVVLRYRIIVAPDAEVLGHHMAMLPLCEGSEAPAHPRSRCRHRVARSSAPLWKLADRGQPVCHRSRWGAWGSRRDRGFRRGALTGVPWTAGAEVTRLLPASFSIER